MKKEYYIGALLGIAILIGIFLTTNLDRKLGGAQLGLHSQVTSTTITAVSGTVSTVFATSTTGSCASRIVHTGTEAIKVMFSQYNNTQPSATLGFYQAASTTLLYDSSTYGCDAWRVFGFGASSITTAETR